MCVCSYDSLVCRGGKGSRQWQRSLASTSSSLTWTRVVNWAGSEPVPAPPGHDSFSRHSLESLRPLLSRRVIRVTEWMEMGGCEEDGVYKLCIHPLPNCFLVSDVLLHSRWIGFIFGSPVFPSIRSHFKARVYWKLCWKKTMDLRCQWTVIRLCWWFASLPHLHFSSSSLFSSLIKL